jgi:hypothetical protein
MTPSPSGPRGASASFIRWSAESEAGDPSKVTAPEIPHMISITYNIFSGRKFTEHIV